MKDDNAYTGAHLLIAFLAGAAAGAAVAMLTAPQSGTDTRDTIRGWARDAQGKATRVPGALKEAYAHAAQAAREAFTKALNEEAAEEVETS